MPDSPSILQSKTIHCWSGDHRGLPTCGPPNEVSCISPVPSLLAVQISKLPVRLDENTMRSPRAEYCGLKSRRLDEINSYGRPSSPAPVGSTRQIFASRITLE